MVYFKTRIYYTPYKFLVKGGIKMAKDMLDAIYKTEEQCSKREADAKAHASQKIEQSRQEAAKLISKARENAINDADNLCRQAKAAGENDLKKAIGEAESRCNALSKTAEKNRSRVIKSAIEMLVG